MKNPTITLRVEGNIFWQENGIWFSSPVMADEKPIDEAEVCEVEFYGKAEFDAAEKLAWEFREFAEKFTKVLGD